jgi:hypothetical protein
MKSIDTENATKSQTWFFTKNLFVKHGISSSSIVPLFSQLVFLEITTMFGGWSTHGTDIWNTQQRTKRTNTASFYHNVGYKLYFADKIEHFIKDNHYAYVPQSQPRDWL